jgi:hypothetical protein
MLPLRGRKTRPLLLDGSSLRDHARKRWVSTELDEDGQPRDSEIPRLPERQRRSELWTGTMGARRAWTVSMISVLSIVRRAVRWA